MSGVSPFSSNFRPIVFRNVVQFPFSVSHYKPIYSITPFPNLRILAARCYDRSREVDGPIDRLTAYSILGVESSCSHAELKAAFRAKVKQFHPDVNRGLNEFDVRTRRVIEAYELLIDYRRSANVEREYVDPFDEPECEPLDIFVNEVLCIGRGCSHSCVDMAPHAFFFDSSTGTARAKAQGLGADYRVQRAVSRCPRSCIYNVTPCQRAILEEILVSILDAAYDTSAEQDSLYSLIVKARFQNNRFEKPQN